MGFAAGVAGSAGASVVAGKMVDGFVDSVAEPGLGFAIATPGGVGLKGQKIAESETAEVRSAESRRKVLVGWSLSLWRVKVGANGGSAPKRVRSSLVTLVERVVFLEVWLQERRANVSTQPKYFKESK